MIWARWSGHSQDRRLLEGHCLLQSHLYKSCPSPHTDIGQRLHGQLAQQLDRTHWACGPGDCLPGRHTCAAAGLFDQEVSPGTSPEGGNFCYIHCIHAPRCPDWSLCPIFTLSAIPSVPDPALLTVEGLLPHRSWLKRMPDLPQLSPPDTPGHHLQMHHTHSRSNHVDAGAALLDQVGGPGGGPHRLPRPCIPLLLRHGVLHFCPAASSPTVRRFGVPPMGRLRTTAN